MQPLLVWSNVKNGSREAKMLSERNVDGKEAEMRVVRTMKAADMCSRSFTCQRRILGPTPASDPGSEHWRAACHIRGAVEVTLPSESLTSIHRVGCNWSHARVSVNARFTVRSTAKCQCFLSPQLLPRQSGFGRPRGLTAWCPTRSTTRCI